MKIEKLDLAAFGPFTDRVLAFRQPGLHIVYGPNEAGKSSSLRALKALLYGIDSRSRDNFIHANTKLRIGGTVQNSAGEQLEFYRRKGNKNTLLSAEGQKLDDQALTPFLNGVSGELFETLFAIDHQALLRGGQQILEQQGEVGQALFSAALGSHVLRSVLNQLDIEARELFLPSASNPKINANIKKYKELKKQIRESSLSSSSWEKSRLALKSSSDELFKIQEALREHRRELNRLKRVQRVLPKLARRASLLSQLESMKNVVELKEGFPQRHQRAVNDLAIAQRTLAKQEPHLAQLKAQLNDLSIDQGLLDQSEQINELYSGLGAYRQAIQDRPELVSKRQHLLTESINLLKEIRPDLMLDQIERLRPLLQQRQSTMELGNQRVLLDSRLKQIKLQLLEASHKRDSAVSAQERLPPVKSSDALHNAITAARKLGDLDSAIQANQAELSILQKSCDDSLSRLTLWAGDLQGLSVLPLPSRENIDHFEQQYNRLEQQLLRNSEDQQNTEHEIEAAQKRLDEIQGAGRVPSEVDLNSARSDRDKLWQRLRRQWLNGGGFSKEPLLPDAYEKSVMEADELSDRLRRESDRVSSIASLRAQEKSALRKKQNLFEQHDDLQDAKTQIDTEWRLLWSPCAIDPETPREMRAWLVGFEKLQAQIERLNLLKYELDHSQRIRTAHLTGLTAQLTAIEGEKQNLELGTCSLESLLLDCEAAAHKLDDDAKTRHSVEQEVRAASDDIALIHSSYQLAEEELNSWQQSWDQLITTFGLQHSASPTELNGFIEQLRMLFEKKNQIDALENRIHSIDQSVESFCERAHGLRNQLALDTFHSLDNLNPDPDEMVKGLYRLLSDNRSVKVQHQNVEQQIEQLQAELQAASSTVTEMNSVLDELCREAKCSHHEQLDQAQQQAADYQAVKLNIEQNLSEILEVGEGAGLEQLQRETEGMNPDQLVGQIETITTIIDLELEPRATELAQLKGSETKAMELMGGGDQAAELADEAQAVLARLRSDSERYVRVKLAAKLLRDEIERYRKQNQGPLIERASEHFAALTQGSFEALTTDFNDRDEPVIEGVRAGGGRVMVEGMSTGSRDQLYLALRLASLEKYMENAEPMPFIVDDILVDFDDKRSEAALNTLSDFADKTQVIVFTHHSRVVDQARGLLRPAQLHEL